MGLLGCYVSRSQGAPAPLFLWGVLMPSRARWPMPGHTATNGTTGLQCHFYSVLKTAAAWQRWASQIQAARSWQSARVVWMIHLSGRWNSHFFPWDSISDQIHVFRCGRGAFWSLLPFLVCCSFYFWYFLPSLWLMRKKIGKTPLLLIYYNQYNKVYSLMWSVRSQVIDSWA